MDLILTFVLGVGTCFPVRVECPQAMMKEGIELQFFNKKEHSLHFTAEHLSDPTTRADRGREEYMFEYRYSIKL